jgi:hypothetical protein
MHFTVVMPSRPLRAEVRRWRNKVRRHLLPEGKDLLGRRLLLRLLARLDQVPGEGEFRL